MSFSNYTAQAVLNSLFGKTSNFGELASRPTIYVALSTADPLEDGSGVAEPAGNGYARAATTPADWNDATLADPSVINNANAIAFPQATGAWGTITHFADRKSTRLNSSHVKISYAVFCLKKKKKHQNIECQR